MKVSKSSWSCSPSSVVMRRPAGEIGLGLGAEAQQHVDRHLAVLRLDDLHDARQGLADLAGHVRAARQPTSGRPCSGSRGRRRAAGPRTPPRADCRDRATGRSARCRAIASGSSAKRPAATAAPSTTAITPSTVTREAISGQLNAFTSGLGSARPEVSITMCSGGFGRSSSALQRRHEIVGDGAADAAVGQLDDRVLGAALDAAALQDLAVDADIAELVDDHREAAAVGILQHVAHQRGLPGAEEAGDDGAGHLGESAHDGSFAVGIGGTRAMVFWRTWTGRSRQTVRPSALARCRRANASMSSTCRSGSR